MKKLIFALAAFAALTLSSCNKEVDFNGNVESNIEKVVYSFDFTVSSPIVDSKAAKTGWAEGDKLNIWFDGAVSDPQVVMTFDGSSWTSEQKDENLQLNENGGKLSVLYESNNDFASLSDLPLVIKEENVSYTLDETNAKAEFAKWAYVTPYQIVVKGITANFGDYTLSCENLTSGSSITKTAKDGYTNFTVSEAPTGTAAKGFANTDGAAFYFTESNATAAQQFTFVLTYNGKQYSYTSKSTTIYADGTNTKRVNKKLPEFSLVEGSLASDSAWKLVGGDTPEEPKYVKVTSARSDWRGNYLIAYSSSIFMNGSLEGGTGGVGKAQTHVSPDGHISSDECEIDSSWGDQYYVTIEAINDSNINDGYVIKSHSSTTPYFYQTSNANGMASTNNKNTAASYPITITFNSENDIDLALGGKALGAILHYNSNSGTSGEMFRFYKNGGQNNIYLYRRTVMIDSESETDPVPEYSSLSDLVENNTPTDEGTPVTVTLTNEVIQEIHVSKSGNRTGVYLVVNDKQIEIFCSNVPADWTQGGTLSGTLENCVWKIYNSTWELCPDDWTGLEYTAPVGAITYDIIIDENIQNGIVTASANKGKAGDEITLFVTPSFGYEFNEWNVVDATNNVIDVVNNKFIMPAANVTVSASFAEIPPLDLDGDYVILARDDEERYYALSADPNGTTQRRDRIVVNYDGTDQFETSNNKIVWTIEKSGSLFKISNYGQYLTKAQKTLPLGSIDDAVNILIADNNDGTYTFTITDNDTFTTLAMNGQYGFAWYASSTGVNNLYIVPVDYSAPTEYDITVTKPTNGTVTTNKSKAPAGETITVTATPDSGYQLSTLTCNGEDIKSTMSFTMPAEDVTIAATFEEDAGGSGSDATFTINSAAVVTNSGYDKYETTVDNRAWLITFGGNNKSVGTNSGNRSKCTLSNYDKYAVSPVTTSDVASAFASTSKLNNVKKISYTVGGGSNQASTNVYLIYSSDGNTFSQITLAEGTQGDTISSGTEYEFAKCSGYFALLFKATNSSGAWRIDDVNITFTYEE